MAFIYLWTLSRKTQTLLKGAKDMDKKIAYMYDNGYVAWTEDEDGVVIEESVDRRKVYYQTQAQGYEVVVKDDK